jgi:hypothetical protein
MISDFQYERLAWLIDNKDLSEAELRIISNLLRHTWPTQESEDANMQWIIHWLREKPMKHYKPFPQPILGPLMTDEEYETLVILIESKQLTHNDLENIIQLIDDPAFTDWRTVINWLWRQPNIPLKRRRRMTATDSWQHPSL